MDDVARMPTEERRELFTEAAYQYGTTYEVIEKDFWVTWTLNHIFSLKPSPAHLVFKGGTSLSKVYRVIERFSEDIDLSLSREDLGFSGEKDPHRASSRKKQDALVEQLVERCKVAIAEELLPSLGDRFAQVLGGEQNKGSSWSLALDHADPQTINFEYPSNQRTLTRPIYLKPFVRLELGARSDHWSAEDHTITALLDEVMPGVIKADKVCVRVLSAERTFWEKATILHAEYHRPMDKPSRERLTRHYYDVVKLWRSDIGRNALSNFGLLAAVVRHKMLFFRASWAKYEEAKPGSFHLVPNGRVIPKLREDYSKMRENMIFGEAPSFEQLMKELDEMENCINGIVEKQS